MSKLVKVQKTQIRRINKNDKVGYERSPYWNFLSRQANSGDPYDNRTGMQELKEPVQANPDSLSEDSALYHVTEEQKETQKMVRRAIKRAKLSARERQVLEMSMYTVRTQKDIADILGITQPVISIYYKRALLKIKKFIEKENK